MDIKEKVAQLEVIAQVVTTLSGQLANSIFKLSRAIEEVKVALASEPQPQLEPTPEPEPEPTPEPAPPETVVHGISRAMIRQAVADGITGSVKFMRWLKAEWKKQGLKYDQKARNWAYDRWYEEKAKTKPSCDR